MPKPETSMMASERLTISGDHELVRLSGVTTEDGPRALIEVLMPPLPGCPERPLAAVTMDRHQLLDAIAALAKLWGHLSRETH